MSASIAPTTKIPRRRHVWNSPIIQRNLLAEGHHVGLRINRGMARDAFHLRLLYTVGMAKKLVLTSTLAALVEIQ